VEGIDESLEDIPDENVFIRWVKGHNGIAGNERADELAEMGREQVATVGESLNGSDLSHDDLDERYRQIMGAA